MRTPRLGWIARCTPWMLASILMTPIPAPAQCGMMGGGGHDHSTMRSKQSRKAPASQRKLQQSIDRLLSDSEGRAMLATALLNDRSFMEDLLQRMATIPEWRSMATRRLALGSAGDSLGAARPEGASVVADLYACPMHPDVTSSKPGACPKCGMTLVRAATEHSH